MKRRTTLILVLLLALAMPSGIFAKEYVSVIEGDLASLRLYEPTGTPIALETIDVDDLRLGTILVTGGDAVVLETSRGDIKLFPDSILILDEVSARSTTLLLIDGAVTARTAQGILSIITPATLYELDRSGEVHIVSTRTEERVQAYDVSVRATNLITHRTTTIDPLQELELSDPTLTKRPLAATDAVEERIVPPIRVPDRPGAIHWTTDPQFVEEVEEIRELARTLPPRPQVLPAKVEAVPVAKEKEVVPVTPRTTTLRDSAPAPVQSKGSYGVEASYALTFPIKSASYWPNHRLEVKPFISYNSLALRLRILVETDSFTSLDTNFLDLDPTALGVASFLFGIVDQVKIGYSTSPFHLVVEQGGSPGARLSPFIASTCSPDKLALYNTISIGGFRLTTGFDDLRFTNIITDSGSQLGSTVLEYTLGGSYPLRIALGTLAIFESQDSLIAKTDLFPLLELSFPIINTRRTRFSALLLASGYLPVHPKVKIEEFFDMNSTYFFPNHQLGIGLTVDHGPLSAQMMGSLAGGKNHLLLFNDIAEAHERIEHDGLVDLYASGTWKSRHFTANLVVNVPFTREFALARVKGETQSADFGRIDFTYTGNAFNLALGASRVGFLSTLKNAFQGGPLKPLLYGAWASSFLEASYTYRIFTFTGRLDVPIALNDRRPSFALGVKVRFDGGF
ncbi:MAG: hypothetical protein GX911_06820 [Spirochaetales bacterium]|nr:hypothetical protein [Spirochaetales bacterium]